MAVGGITGYKLEEIPSGGKISEMRTDPAALARLMSRSSYEDAGSAVRELVANSQTAVKTAAKLGYIREDEGLVHVTLDGDRLVIADNGIGMDDRTIHEYLSVMGRSGNKHREFLGMYGIGFFSHRMITKNIRVDTVTQDGTGRAFSCRNGRTFRSHSKCNRHARGTTVSMRLDGPEGGDIASMRVMAYSLSYLAEVPIQVVCFGNDGGIKRNLPLSAAREAKDIYHDFGDVEVLARTRCVGINSVRLQGMPIKCEIDSPFYIEANIRNEEMFSPLPSKDSLSIQGTELLNHNIARMVRPVIERIGKIRTYRQLHAAPYDLGWELVSSNSVREYAEQHGIHLAASRFIPRFPPPDYEDKRLFMHGKRYMRGADALLNTAIVYDRDARAETPAPEGKILLRPMPSVLKEADEFARFWKLPPAGGATGAE